MGRRARHEEGTKTHERGERGKSVTILLLSFCSGAEGCSLEKANLDQPDKSQIIVVTDWPEASLVILQMAAEKPIQIGFFQ